MAGKNGVSPVLCGNTVIRAGEKVNSVQTVAADLFCYMDDEVDIWGSCMRKVAMVFLPSDE